MKIDWGIIWTIIGVGIATVFSICGIVYTFIRNFKGDMRNDIIKLDDRMFQLAMGKSFREILLEEKKAEEEKK